MKKMYQKPTMTVVKVQATSMLMESVQGDVNATMDHEWDEVNI